LRENAGNGIRDRSSAVRLTLFHAANPAWDALLDVARQSEAGDVAISGTSLPS